MKPRFCVSMLLAFVVQRQALLQWLLLRQLRLQN
jgi:hypothetical protein